MPEVLSIDTQGDYRTLKFILDSKDRLDVQVTVSSGLVDVYLGLDPDNVMTNYLAMT